MPMTEAGEIRMESAESGTCDVSPLVLKADAHALRVVGQDEEELLEE